MCEAINIRKAAFLLAAVFIMVAGLTPGTGQSASNPEPQEIAGELTCGKCGMFPARYPQWQSQVIFSDGSMIPFDGCKCMFDFMFNMEKFDQVRTADQIDAVWVRDFTSGQWTNAQGAHFVLGSDVIGPMGKELIPFADQAGAEAFRKEHGGEISGYGQIDMQVLQPLMGKKHMKGKMNMQNHMDK